VYEDELYDREDAVYVVGHTSREALIY
jgi:hypothetical protein